MHIPHTGPKVTHDVPAGQQHAVHRLRRRGLHARGLRPPVDGELRVTWVQPRVLDNAQLARVGEQLDEWAAKAHTALTFLDDQTPELFA